MALCNKILIVDDSRSVRIALHRILSSHYDLKQADCGEEALNILPAFNPDLVLLDVEMPGMTGYEVCRRIRAGNSPDSIKIIMVSTRVKLDDRLKGYEAGADDYLGKPFSAEELLAKAKVFLGLKAFEDNLAQHNNRLQDQMKLRTAQLMDAEKMAALGRLTAGIVHNLNSPLQVIMSNAELLKFKYPHELQIAYFSKAANEMKRIISTLLTTSRLENDANVMYIDLNDVITNQIELLKANRFYAQKINTELELEPLPLYKGVYTDFSQSIGNLIKNAVEAMYESDARWLYIASKLEDKAIVIQISDTGPGIAPEDMARIFDPFFTSKPLNAVGDKPCGTGLGLPSSKEMIESYGGRITVDSKPGNGSTFKVILPLPATREMTSSTEKQMELSNQ